MNLVRLSTELGLGADDGLKASALALTLQITALCRVWEAAGWALGLACVVLLWAEGEH